MNHQNNMVCPTCSRPFFAHPSRISGARLKFCSSSCHYMYTRREDVICRGFWKKVDSSGGTDACWDWCGGLFSTGYGMTYIGGKTCGAHRVAWELVNGPIPGGLLVLHACDRQRCCNPKHLSLGTNKENMVDASIKGRLATGNRSGQHTHPERRARGEKVGGSKLTEQSVTAIRQRYLAGGITQKELANQYGVRRQTVQRLLKRRTWDCIP